VILFASIHPSSRDSAITARRSWLAPPLRVDYDGMRILE
jgi:hypothetical protein